MKIHKLFLVLGMSVMMMSGCEKVIDFPMDDVESRVVVNSNVTSDSTVSLRLTYSRFFLDGSNFRNVEDATVSLFCNGTKYSVSNDGAGNYSSGLKPQPGDSVSLEVEVPGRELVKAGCKMPQPANYEVLELMVDTSDYYYNYCRMRLKINDKAGEGNYYRVWVLGWNCFWDRDEEGNTVYRYSNDRIMTLSCSDVVFSDAASLDYILNEGDNAYTGQYLTFSDQLFDGNGHVFTVDFGYDDYNWTEEDGYLHMLPPDQFPIQVFVSAISKEEYLYRKSVAMRDQDDLTTMLTEPVQVYTNIENGLGIFCARTISKSKMPAVYQRFNHNSDYWKKSK